MTEITVYQFQVGPDCLDMFRDGGPLAGFMPLRFPSHSERARRLVDALGKGQPPKLGLLPDLRMAAIQKVMTDSSPYPSGYRYAVEATEEEELERALVDWEELEEAGGEVVK